MMNRHEDIRAMVDDLTIAQVRHSIEFDYGVPLWSMNSEASSIEEVHRDQLFELILEHDAMGNRS